jgi:cobalt/nickel transport protein
MKSRSNGFVSLILGISLFMALILSPFVSSSPDGLVKVAQAKGFSQKGGQWKLWNYAPMRDYTVPWIKNEKVSTAFSGLIGTLSIFLTSLGVGKLIKNRKV